MGAEMEDPPVPGPEAAAAPTVATLSDLINEEIHGDRPKPNAALPRPGMLRGNVRARPTSARPLTPRFPARAPQAAPVPRGARPPSTRTRPAPTEEDTGALVKAAAEDLAATPRTGTAGGVDAMPAEPANDSFVVSSKPGRSSWLLAAAGVAVAGLLLFVAIPSGELEPRQSSASKAAAVAAPPSMSAAPERPRTQGAGEGASANRPETPLPTTDARGPAARNGPADELAAADRAAAGGTEDEFIAEAPTPIDDIDDIDVIDEAAEEMPAAGDDQPKPVAADEETAATRVTSRSAAPHPSSSRHRSKRSRSRRSAARSKPPERETKAPEKPAVRGPSDKSADELLADATAALRANNNSTALQLASMSNRKHRSYSALQVMARAACRLKRTATANSAFARLPLARRSGIRSECRGHGVRLGV